MSDCAVLPATGSCSFQMLGSSIWACVVFFNPFVEILVSHCCWFGFGGWCWWWALLESLWWSRWFITATMSCRTCLQWACRCSVWQRTWSSLGLPCTSKTACQLPFDRSIQSGNWARMQSDSVVLTAIVGQEAYLVLVSQLQVQADSRRWHDQDQDEITEENWYRTARHRKGNPV